MNFVKLQIKVIRFFLPQRHKAAKPQRFSVLLSDFESLCLCGKGPLKNFHMKISRFLLSIFLLISNFTYSQSQYELDLKSESWSFSPSIFYFTDIVDDRIDKGSAGQVLIGDKSAKAKFPNSLETDIKNLLSNSLVPDNSKVHLLLSIDKFSLKESGNAAHHKITFEYSMKVFRIINNKRYQLYEVSGMPVLDIKGPYPNPYDRIIRESLRKSIEGFNSWMNSNPDQVLLAQKVVVVYDDAPANSSSPDTILWNNNYKLKWTDFKGKPGSSSFMAESNCVFTYRAIPVVKNRILEIHINLNAAFDKLSSWVRPGQERDTLLAHEQLHFDICELNMRKLREKILSSTFDMMEYGSQIGELFNKAWSDYQMEQQKYDDETEHGIVAEKQEAWQKDVRVRLSK